MSEENENQNNVVSAVMAAVSRINAIFTEYPDMAKMVSSGFPVLHAKIEGDDKVSVVKIPAYELDALESLPTFLMVMTATRSSSSSSVFPLVVVAEIARKISYLKSVMHLLSEGADMYYYVRSDSKIMHPDVLHPVSISNVEDIMKFLSLSDK